ncbi:DUF2760 domain-containing protein [Tautonia plasticadhaerens]|uniref:DUF2760 domain-containing protein n=1 Tax=Tautonia plasticadhaerens TaxID=2527974 RepID=UPI00119F2A53|nr:DUF2760 domain-containing protein [Tautonia plasticadhaerens]
MNRFMLSLRAFWDALTDRERAERIQIALGPPSAEGPDLRILALMQRDGRLIDFLQEEIDGYSDDQVGAAVRDIHRGCRKAMAEYLTVEKVLPQDEGAPVSVEPDFDPAAVRLLGNVSGAGPFRGTLKHHGWRVSSARLPATPSTRDGSTVLAPAEVELS